MPHLSWSEVRDRAIRFSRDPAITGARSERSEKQTFWNAFFEVFGLRRASIASFEENVRNLKGHTSAIDLLWKGRLLVEHKSFGEDLDLAATQAFTYIEDLTRENRWDEVPRFVLVSDFARFVLYDLEPEDQLNLPLFQGRQIQRHGFTLTDFPRHIRDFAFMLGQTHVRLDPEDPANDKAYARMCELHDALKDGGFTGHELERLLVRILFCLFAEDTGIFAPDAFTQFIRARTREDGSDLGQHLNHLFEILDTPQVQRQFGIDDELAAFPYVNGALFTERLRTAVFTRAMRDALRFCCDFQWAKVSPAVFGSLFQGVLEDRTRRQQGAHYTSERDVMKVLRSLFLNDLRADWQRILADRSTRRRASLETFHQKLRGLQLLDPACGCGNFLVLAYRELRALEIEVIKEIAAGSGGQQLLPTVDVDQFHGIEYSEWPVRIAEVALWLMDHMMNQRAAEEFAIPFERLPLRATPHIVHANALRVEWQAVLPRGQCSYVLGNPPFIGHHYQSVEQKADQDLVMAAIQGNGVLDYVCNWYVRAAQYIQGTRIPVAFVSTNSITQGEQAGLLWNHLFQRYQIKIHFGHRTFAWASESRGKAHVHVVIVGFGAFDVPEKRLYDYDANSAEPTVSTVPNISPYLVAGPDRAISNLSLPLCDVPKMSWGNKPTDGGHLILSPQERQELIIAEPEAVQFIRRYMSGGDFINGIERYCLWLKDASPAVLRRLPRVLARVEAVRQSRLASKAPTTRAYARQPTLFRQIAQPDSDYLAIPEVSSERREYIPMAYLSREVICSNKIQFVPNATRYLFGVLTSAMHIAWARAIGGRLKSDFSYSNTLVYNNFPWPTPTPEQRLAVEVAARAVLAAREPHLPPGGMSTLADLYDPLSMPVELARAHAQLNRAVEKCYRPEPFRSDRERVEDLFRLYEGLTAPLLPATPGRRRRRNNLVAAAVQTSVQEDSSDDELSSSNAVEEALPTWYRETLATISDGLMDDGIDRINDELLPLLTPDRLQECDAFLAHVVAAEIITPLPVLLSLLSTTRQAASLLPHRAALRAITGRRLSGTGRDAEKILKNL